MITSLSNAKIRHLRELQDKSKARNKEKLFVSEGFKMFDEADISLLKEVYVEEIQYEKMKECAKDTPLCLLGRCFLKLEECKRKGVFVETVSTEVFNRASDTKTPQGLIFILEQLAYSLDGMLSGNLLILEDIQDPGNLGTMIRTGEGAGISGIILSKGCVDIYNPKTIRSTMGSLYRVPFVYVEDLKEAIGYIKDKGVRVYAAHLKGEVSFDQIEYRGRNAFMIGNEGNGLKDETAELSDMYVRIPMSGKLESLNAAIAAALLMYAARQSGK